MSTSVDDLLHRGDVRAIAGEELVAQRHPLTRDDEGEADLHAVRPVIAAVAPLGQGIGEGLPLEVGARDVVEEQVVVQGEEFAESRDQVLLQSCLVGEKAIQSAVEAIVVDERRGQRQQVLERGSTIPVLGDVQFARGLTQSGQHQHGGHRGPGHRRAPGWQQVLEQFVQAQRAPEGPAQPHIPEGPPTFEADAMEPDRNRLVPLGERCEEFGLLARAQDRVRQRLRAGAALCIEFAQVRDGLLDDFSAHAHRADQPPVRVDLTVLASRGMPQIHLAFRMRHAHARSQ